MKPLRRYFILALFLGLLCVALWSIGWAGHWIIRNFFVESDLRVDEVPDMMLPLGQHMYLNFSGEGFSGDTTVSLISKLTNDKAIIASLPFEEALPESLVAGDTLYLGGDHSGLKVVDIEYPDSPQFLKTYLPGRTVENIYQANGRLYVSQGRLGIAIMLIRENGLLVNEVEVPTKASISSTVYAEGHLYAAAGEDGIEVYAVNSPKNVELARTIDSQLFVSDLSVFGKYLIAVSPRKNEIGIYSLDVPSDPRRLAEIRLSERIFDASIKDGRLFVATSDGLSIYDIDADGIPHMATALSLVGVAQKLFNGNDKIYVVDSFSGITIVDPRKMRVEGTLLFNDVHSVAEGPAQLYLTGLDSGLAVIATEKVDIKRKVRSLLTRGLVTDLVNYKERLIVADSIGGVLVGNLARQDSESVFAQISSADSRSLALRDNLLFVAQPYEGIEVLDVSNVDSPLSVSQLYDFSAQKLDFLGSYLVVSEGVAGVSLLDVDNINTPRVVDRVGDLDVMDMAVDGEYLFVASQKRGVVVLQLHEDRLIEIGRLQVPYPMNRFDVSIALAVHDGVAYIATGRSGLLVVDVANPRIMKILSAIPLPGVSKGVYVYGGRLYVVNHNAGLSVLDLESPRSPHLLGHLKVSGLAKKILVTSGVVYLTRYAGGLMIVPEAVVPKRAEILSTKSLSVQLPSPQLPGTYGIQISNKYGLVELESTIEFYDPTQF